MRHTCVKCNRPSASPSGHDACNTSGEYTKAQIEALRESIPQRKDCGMFLHCKSCIPDKLPYGMSPEQFGSYELASCSIEISKSKRVSVLTAWCKHCGKLVWDSRHLRHAY